MGIALGLQDFNVDDIEGSIPPLLEGLKGAFWTSIVGIGLSVFFGKWSKYALRKVEQKERKADTQPQQIHEMDEADALRHIAQILKENKALAQEQLEEMKGQKEAYSFGFEKQEKQLEELRKALTGEGDNSLAYRIKDLSDKQEQQHKELKEAIIGEGDNSLASIMRKSNNEVLIDLMEQVRKALTEQMSSLTVEIHQQMSSLTEKIHSKMSALTEGLQEEMSQLTQKLEAQVSALTQEMSELIGKLVKENFDQLNQSVAQMNTWQQENKAQIETLTAQFRDTSERLQLSAQHIESITESTSKLTREDSHLTKLIEALQEVMIEDTKYQQIVGQLTEAIGTVKQNIDKFDGTTDTFDKTANKLSDWVSEQMNDAEKVSKQLSESVEIIETARKGLREDLTKIDDTFNDNLKTTFDTLEGLMQGVADKHLNKDSDR